MASKNTGRRGKPVRDRFTIPKAEFAAIGLLKVRAISLGTSVKKSELLRAGLMTLMGLSDAAYKAAIAAVPAIKAGRHLAGSLVEAAPTAPARTTAPSAPVPAKSAPSAVAKRAIRQVSEPAARKTPGPSISQSPPAPARPKARSATGQSATKAAAKTVAVPRKPAGSARARTTRLAR